MKLHNKSLFFLVIAGLFWSLSVSNAYAQGLEVSVREVKDMPEKYLDKRVVVKGKLKLVGDYWKEHEWFIEDTEGNRIRVTHWARHEVALPFPLPSEKRVRPKIMSDYIDKDLLISGHVKFDTKGKYYYVYVESVKELQEK